MQTITHRRPLSPEDILRFHSGVSDGGVLTKARYCSTFRLLDRMDGSCELQVSHESLGFLITAQQRERESEGERERT